MDLQTLTTEFLVSKAAGGRSLATIYNYQWNLESFTAWCEEEEYSGNDLVGAIAAENIEDHLLWMQNHDYSQHTILQRFRALRAFYRWVEKRHGRFEQGNPFDLLIEPKAPDLLPKALTFGQLQVLLHSIKGERWTEARDRLLLKLFFYTGVRVAEMASLSVADVDLARRRLRIRRWKTKSEDLVPFSRSLQSELSIWLTVKRPPCEHDGLWPSMLFGGDGSKPGDRLAVQGLRQMVRYRCERAGLPPIFPHALRHGCAVHIIERGGDISLVKRVLGHKDIRTSQIYLRFDTDQVTGLYDRIFD